MSSKKYEKADESVSSSASASSCAPSFWKKSSLAAVPGRPAHSGSALRVTTTKPQPSTTMPTSFKAFEASVWDAWDVRDDLPQSVSSSTSTVSTNMDVVSSVTDSDVNNPAAKTGSQAAGSVSSGQTPNSSPRKNDKNIGSSKYENGSASVTPVMTKVEKVNKLFTSDSVDLEALRAVSWSGLVPEVRSKVWKILCGYLPGSVSRQGEVLQRKQAEYEQYVQQYFHTKDQDIHQETYRQIHIDIPRMSPVISLFQQKCVQEIFERILYIWAIRHPASGYVQGINDLITPFFLVFLQDYCKDREISEIDVAIALDEEAIRSVEADSFWCLSKVLDGIQDNYTFAQPGIQLKVKLLEDLIRRIDKELHDHLTKHEVLYLQFAFRWMNNILMRELPIKATIRLWDTYLSELEGFSQFHLYVCAAFLIHWKSDIMKKNDFHTLLMFLQNLPTAKWGDKEINLLVAEAFRLSYLFANAPSHLNMSPSTSATNAEKK